MSWTLLYLGFVAFLPFPTALFGEYEGNPVAVSVFALSMAMVSALEVVLFEHARRSGLLTRQIPENIYRWERRSSLTPVVFFVLSVPLAFLIPRLTPLFWLLSFPAIVLLNRRRLPGADEYL